MQFPTVHPILHDGYNIELDDGVVESRSADGTPRYRRLWDSDWALITFRVGPLAADDKLGLLQFYNSYKYQYIEWTDPFTGVVYDAIMRKYPKTLATKESGGRTCVMEIYMEGVKSES